MWKPFQQKGLHFIHLNINSLLSKIDELREIAKNSNAAVIGITETKVDSSIFDSEIEIEGYSLLRNDRNRHGGGVACYVRSNMCFNIIDNFAIDIEQIFFDILLPSTKPFTVGVVYRPPDQNNLLTKMKENFNKLLPEEKEFYILGDFNINILLDGKYILENNKNNELDSLSVSNIGKQYIEFCLTNSMKQLIKSPTRITSNSSSLIDHILTNSSHKVTQSGVIDVTLSDHQLIYCTRKINRAKFNFHKQIKCRSFKKYSPENFLKELESSNFLNYENFEDIDEAYFDFSRKLTSVIDKVAPMREIRVKNNSPEWFDREISEALKSRHLNFKKFKKSRSVPDEKNFKTSKYICRNLIKNKKKVFLEKKFNENAGKPKELWKTLKSLGLPHKSTETSNFCLQNKGKMSFDAKENAEIFKDYFSELAGKLLSKLPISQNVFGISSTANYYKELLDSTNKFEFSKVTVAAVAEILKNVEPSKAPGIDSLSGKFLKDGANVLAVPITQICNLSIKLSSFPLACKIAKLKPIFKKGSKTDPKNYRPISLLPLVSKIFEKIIHDQTIAYLNENNILFRYQSGFRKNHSTFCSFLLK
mgnify:FL=1